MGYLYKYISLEGNINIQDGGEGRGRSTATVTSSPWHLCPSAAHSLLRRKKGEATAGKRKAASERRLEALPLASACPHGVFSLTGVRCWLLPPGLGVRLIRRV